MYITCDDVDDNFNSGVDPINHQDDRAHVSLHVTPSWSRPFAPMTKIDEVNAGMCPIAFSNEVKVLIDALVMGL